MGKSLNGIDTLALDLGGKTGYAVRFDDGSETSGTLCLVRGNLGGRRSPLPMMRLLSRLRRMITRFRIRKVIFEETFGRGDAKYRLDSLQHAVILWAMDHQITWQRIAVKDWKRRMVGNGNANKVEYWSKAMDEFAGQHRVHSDDIAVALWLLKYERVSQ